MERTGFDRTDIRALADMFKGSTATVERDPDEVDDEIEDKHFGRDLRKPAKKPFPNSAPTPSNSSSNTTPADQQKTNKNNSSSSNEHDATKAALAKNEVIHQRNALIAERKKIVEEYNDTRDEDDHESFATDIAGWDKFDTRQEPQYKLSYKQEVGIEDVYMGTEKTPATSSCNDITIRIQLPDTELSSIQCNVVSGRQPSDRYDDNDATESGGTGNHQHQQQMVLKCTTPKYKLLLPLPHPINKNESRGAQWNANKHELTVTLRVLRPYDFSAEQS